MIEVGQWDIACGDADSCPGHACGPWVPMVSLKWAGERGQRMAGYAEAGAELPSPWNIPFKIWLKLPDFPRRVLILLVFYPVIAFMSVVSVFQILSRWVDMDPVQRYALRGLGIDKQNLIDTSNVIDTVSVDQFLSDVDKDFLPVYIKRGQVVGLVAQIRPGVKPRPQFPVCLQPLTATKSEHVEIGRVEVTVSKSNFKKSIPFTFSMEQQSNALISGKDWREAEELERFDLNDDVRVDISYVPGALYDVPPEALIPADVPRGSPSRANLSLACEEYTVLANIRIAKPELLLNR